MKKIRWGVMGTGGISKSFVSDFPYVTGGELLAVGSRSQESADRFAQTHQIPRAYASYEALVSDSEIDAIYIGTPHPYHKENALIALRAGKAVLCEKPFTMNARELEELIACAAEHKQFLMEAMWTRFLPVFRKIREWIDAGRIGEIRQVKADFGFRLPDDYDPQGRLLNKELGGGAFLDAGIYPLSLASMVFGAEPAKAVSTVQIGPSGVDEQYSILLTYPGGQTALLNGAVRLALPNEAYLIGTKGYIHIPALFLNSKSATLHLHGNEEGNETYVDDRASSGYSFEIEEVNRCLQAGLNESPVMPLQESLDIMQLMDRIRKDWGLQYSADLK
ncbi:Gfo/Idh/MocA family protein [Cohnella boryungensis]|uniref:Gfo/Idh/MocA family protein n=1 Tax=Cohnella boryungensis TaxID=768479 RepID=A0ABV8S6W9_9BACL